MILASVRNQKKKKRSSFEERSTKVDKVDKVVGFPLFFLFSSSPSFFLPPSFTAG